MQRFSAEELNNSIWWIGVSFKDRPQRKDVTTVVRLKRAPSPGMCIMLRGKKVEFVSARSVVSYRFDVLAQVRPVVDKTSSL